MFRHSANGRRRRARRARWRQAKRERRTLAQRRRYYRLVCMRDSALVRRARGRQRNVDQRELIVAREQNSTAPAHWRIGRGQVHRDERLTCDLKLVSAGNGVASINQRCHHRTRARRLRNNQAKVNAPMIELGEANRRNHIATIEAQRDVADTDVGAQQVPTVQPAGR